VDYERITSKYTGVRLTHAALAAQRRRGGIAAELAAAISDTVRTLDATEVDLTNVAALIAHASASATRAIAADPGERVAELNPLGELQTRGPLFDALIRIRDLHIAHLRLLIGLWQHLPTADDPAITT
jgi:hypothetical protein